MLHLTKARCCGLFKYFISCVNVNSAWFRSNIFAVGMHTAAYLCNIRIYPFDYLIKKWTREKRRRSSSNREGTGNEHLLWNFP